uniref:Fe2OG dioxygenase domain-containing protein n=1 Tax=Haptolina brevifila TaxID=156173 RepID=A0A7S2E1U6_9EUKA|mmetsp:Transcript_47250/g.94131  ORF Transcript_47250/g.94131 Transcript_47250/m.94131 type:complete len:399 (+) Transcript_47250:129-1325(+)
MPTFTNVPTFTNEPEQGTLNGRPPLSCAPHSVWHLCDFVSKEEEAAILDCIDAMQASSWITVQGRRVQSIGGHPQEPPAKMLPEAMPDWVQRLCDLLVTAGVFPADAPPNHVVVNDYEPGCGIPLHKDGPMYESRVAILSLGSVASFDFVKHDPAVEDSVEMRRSIETSFGPRDEFTAARGGIESGGGTDSIGGGGGSEVIGVGDDGFDDGFDEEFDLDEFWAMDELMDAARRCDAHAGAGADEDEEPEPEPVVEACPVVHVLHTCQVAASLLLLPRGLLVFSNAAYDKYLHTVPALLSDEGRHNLIRFDLDDLHGSWRLWSPSNPSIQPSNVSPLSVLEAETTASASSSPPLPRAPPPPPRSRRISLTVRRVRFVADSPAAPTPQATTIKENPPHSS